MSKKPKDEDLAVEKVAVFSFINGSFTLREKVDQFDKLHYELREKAKLLSELAGGEVEVKETVTWKVSPET